MMNALGNPQSVLLLGGTSDIALAIAAAYAGQGGLRVVLAARPTERLDAGRGRAGRPGLRGVEVDLRRRDAGPRTPRRSTQAFAGGDIDVAVVAFGLLGDAEQAWTDVADHAVELAEVNYTAPVHLGVRCWPSGCARRATGASSRCPAWPASGHGGPTSSTAPPRPASTGSTWAWARRCASTGSGCWSSGPDSSARR